MDYVEVIKTLQEIKEDICIEQDSIAYRTKACIAIDAAISAVLKEGSKNDVQQERH